MIQRQTPYTSPFGGGRPPGAKRKAVGWGATCARQAAVIATIHPTRLARSQVYAGCVNLPAMLADLPFQGRYTAFGS
jgi:hypothetical protein